MTTAFVLPGGSSIAAVQVGMVEALVAAGIHPDLLFGVSAGAVNAAWLASHPDPSGVAELRRLWLRVRRRDVFPLRPHALALGLLGRRDHLVGNARLRAWMAGVAPVGRLEEARLPLVVMATDALTGEAVALREGPAVPAILASTALPGVFPPVSVDGLLLLDGALAANVPVDLAVEAGADTVYVLPTIGPVTTSATVGAATLGMRGLNFLLAASAAPVIAAAAASATVYVVPAPATERLSPFSFRHAGRLMDEARDRTSAWLLSAEPLRPSPSAPEVLPRRWQEDR